MKNNVQIRYICFFIQFQNYILLLFSFLTFLWQFAVVSTNKHCISAAFYNSCMVLYSFLTSELYSELVFNSTFYCIKEKLDQIQMIHKHIHIIIAGIIWCETILCSMLEKASSTTISANFTVSPWVQSDFISWGLQREFSPPSKLPLMIGVLVSSINHLVSNGKL